MEQPVNENINVEKMTTVPENQQVHTYKEVMKTILEIARDHYDDNYHLLDEFIEECSK